MDVQIEGLIQIGSSFARAVSMGNSCSSGQGHKDKDNMSQRSEESGSYQVRTSITNDKQQMLLNHVNRDQHSGVVLEPATAGVTPPTVVPPTATALPLGSSESGGGGRKPSMGKIMKDSMSLSSPPGTHSPKDFDKIMEGYIPKEVANLSEQLQNLLMGRVVHAKTATRTRKIVLYVSAADSQDCHHEKGALHNAVYPTLRARCRKRGYELHIVDLHWRSLLEKQQDHEFPELCLGELARQMEVAYVIPVLFLSNSLGTALLPGTIESADFQMALQSAENDDAARTLLAKWYQVDAAAQPPCYRLQPISLHIPGFKETSVEDKARALGEWCAEIEKVLDILISVFSQELRDTYLTTVVEQEIHNTVFMSQELAKRCIWLNRIYQPQAGTPEDLTPGQEELHRRLNNLQRDLRPLSSSQNQLTERHIIRIPVRWMEGGLQPKKVPEHASYIDCVVENLSRLLTEMVDTIMEEHQTKTTLRPSYGIDAATLEELNQQTSFCQRAAQCSVNREKTINEIKGYITSDRTHPMVIYGPGGCGKTTLLARIAQCCASWLPEAFLILRFVGISAQSSTVEQLLSSITNQCSILTYGYKNTSAHSLPAYANILPGLLRAGRHLQRPLIIILDGIDQVREFSARSLDWLPTQLPDHVKVLVSVTEDSRQYEEIGRLLTDRSCYVQMPLLGEQEAEGILMTSIMQYNHSVNAEIQDCVRKSVQECTLPLYTKVLAWQSSWWADHEHNIVPKGHVGDQFSLMLEELETILGAVQVQQALAIMTCTKHSITDSEMIDLLAFDENFHSSNTYVCWAPACLIWSRLNKHLAPFLQWTLTGGVLGVQWRDNMLLQAVKERYKDHKKRANQMIFDYYKGKWWSAKPENLSARLVSQDTLLGTCYNRRKLDELPYHHFQLHGATQTKTSEYLNDLTWIYNKVCGSNCYQLLEDIELVAPFSTQDTFVNILREFLQSHAAILNYDGRQFYSHLFSHLESKLASAASGETASLSSNETEQINKILESIRVPPVPSLVPVSSNAQSLHDMMTIMSMETSVAGTPVGTGKTIRGEKCFDVLIRLPEDDRFVVSVSTEREEICVWNVAKCRRVRHLKGISSPTNLIPIDQHRCVVLCRRELCIYDLDRGKFLTKLKGVMNQKMPYFGLHDLNHLVALSRNRMYVNLMNLESGDCVTTFKAGEDRFLNSLLVSGDGRVLVCGDETQKPFPLLVWSLQSKKLLYDLRIPHHDFITSLSAITHEGSYVCCVCHEIDEPSPNFIVVYDLQSGTLFKKWKPSCNTVSLEISSHGSCVISGLEDARILVWDLTTGNCRWSLSGHTAPINLLRLDSTGNICLSTDSEGRDKSMRIWDLNKGNLVAVYTPKRNITACEISANGHYVIIAVEKCPDLITLQLRGPDISEKTDDEPYGNVNNEGKEFQLGEPC